jgi:hypothetical protein
MTDDGDDDEEDTNGDTDDDDDDDAEVHGYSCLHPQVGSVVTITSPTPPSSPDDLNAANAETGEAAFESFVHSNGLDPDASHTKGLLRVARDDIVPGLLSLLHCAAPQPLDSGMSAPPPTDDEFTILSESAVKSVHRHLIAGRYRTFKAFVSDVRRLFAFAWQLSPSEDDAWRIQVCSNAVLLRTHLLSLSLSSCSCARKSYGPCTHSSFFTLFKTKATAVFATAPLWPCVSQLATATAFSLIAPNRTPVLWSWSRRCRSQRVGLTLRSSWHPRCRSDVVSHPSQTSCRHPTAGQGRQHS